MKAASRATRGRPPKGSGQSKTLRLDMRLNTAEKQAFRDAAELAGLDLSAWIRERLRANARQELESVGRPVAFLIRRDRLVKARFTRPSSIHLVFADGYAGTVRVEQLEMPVDRIRWTSAAASADGANLTVTAKKGEPIPIAAGTLRYLVDPQYAAEVDARHHELLQSSAGSEAADEPPPEWFGQPEVDLTLESWK